MRPTNSNEIVPCVNVATYFSLPLSRSTIVSCADRSLPVYIVHADNHDGEFFFLIFCLSFLNSNFLFSVLEIIGLLFSICILLSNSSVSLCVLEPFLSFLRVCLSIFVIQ